MLTKKLIEALGISNEQELLAFQKKWRGKDLSLNGPIAADTFFWCHSFAKSVSVTSEELA